MSDDAKKNCPDCAEPVLAAARVCKHCGFRFDSHQSGTRPASAIGQGPTTGGGAVLGMIGGALGVASVTHEWLMSPKGWAYTFVDVLGFRIACAVIGVVAIVFAVFRLGGVGKGVYRPMIAALGFGMVATWAYALWGPDYTLRAGHLSIQWPAWCAVAGGVLLVLSAPLTTRD